MLDSDLTLLIKAISDYVRSFSSSQQETLLEFVKACRSHEGKAEARRLISEFLAREGVGSDGLTPIDPARD